MADIYGTSPTSRLFARQYDETSKKTRGFPLRKNPPYKTQTRFSLCWYSKAQGNARQPAVRTAAPHARPQPTPLPSRPRKLTPLVIARQSSRPNDSWAYLGTTPSALSNARAYRLSKSSLTIRPSAKALGHATWSPFAKTVPSRRSFTWTSAFVYRSKSIHSSKLMESRFRLVCQ